MRFITVFLVGVLMAGAGACGYQDEAPSGGSITAEQARGLALWYEEEKLAHDVYAALGARWGHDTFTNIQRSEATHMGRVDALLVTRGLDNPARDVAMGVFVTPEFTALYDMLMARGGSLEEALRVGLYIEEKDILDLEALRDEAQEADIRAALDAQLKASSNHLRAFAGALDARGERPQAQLLSPQRFEALWAADGYTP